MIPKNEVRIGNLFLSKDDTEQTVDEDNFEITIVSASKDMIKPLLLCTELLNNKGFEFDTIRNRYFFNNQCRFVLYKISESFFLCEQNDLGTGYCKIKTVESFHQLQNFYSDLTGEELRTRQQVIS